ncbi:MAG: DUF1302 domain-containing protein [Gammaproteobacteria bacterium]|nr:DUF1302 domain-containing protein [Gammaproteobacteria bacterium]
MPEYSLKRRAAFTAGLALACLLPLQATAVELPGSTSGITGYFDTTVSVGAAIRTQGRKNKLIAVSNGGSAWSINEDDGNLNYDTGDFVSANTKITHELELNRGNLGIFARALYFYDYAIADEHTDRTRLSHSAKGYAGYDFELLDAYLDGQFNLGGAPLSIRAGDQVIHWGESVFIRNGLNSINPVDSSKLRVAGAEIRDVLKPITAANLRLGLTDSLFVESFYQFRSAHTELEPAGTFFSTSDAGSPGGKTVHFGFGVPGAADDNDDAPDPSCPLRCSRVPRASDRDADDHGQFGLALRYFSPFLNDAELGLYYARIHSRLPLVSVQAGQPQAIFTPQGFAGSIRYFREFPEDIDLMGASINTEIGTSGFAFQAEISYRRDQPLQIDTTELFYSSLSPLRLVQVPNGAPAPLAAGLQQLQQAGGLLSLSQTGALAPGQELQGFRRKDVLQGSLALTKVLGPIPMLKSSQTVFLAEAGFTRVQGLEKRSELRYEAAGTWTSANPVFTQARIQPATQDGGFADSFSWGYRALLRMTYNNAVGPVSLSPQIAFSHDVNGTAPTPIGNFIEDRKTVTLSINAGYLHSWRAGLSYTNSFGGGAANLLNDRDFLAFTMNYSF